MFTFTLTLTLTICALGILFWHVKDKLKVMWGNDKLKKRITLSLCTGGVVAVLCGLAYNWQMGTFAFMAYLLLLWLFVAGTDAEDI